MNPADFRPEPPRRLCIPVWRWTVAGSPRRISQVPRLICRRAPSPTTPESPAGAYTRSFPADDRFHPYGKADRSQTGI